MSRQLSLSIRQKLIITFVIILLVPSLVISSTTYWKASDYIEEEIMYSAAESVSTANSLITNEIESVGSDLDYFVNELGLERNSQAGRRLKPFGRPNPRIDHPHSGRDESCGGCDDRHSA